MIRRGALQSIVDTRLILSIDHIILVKAPLKMLPHEGSTTRYVSPLVVVREENHRTARQPAESTSWGEMDSKLEAEIVKKIPETVSEM